MVLYLHPHKQGTLAQMVEQWTENPCVPGSIPGGTTKPTQTSGFFVFIPLCKPISGQDSNLHYISSLRDFFQLYKAFITKMQLLTEPDSVNKSPARESFRPYYSAK